MSLVVEGVAEPVQEVADDHCSAVEDAAGLAQEVAGHRRLIDEGAKLVQEAPGIHRLLVEGPVELQGQPLSRLDDDLDDDGAAHRSPNREQISVIIYAIHMVGLRFRSAFGAV